MFLVRFQYRLVSVFWIISKSSPVITAGRITPVEYEGAIWIILLCPSSLTGRELYVPLVVPLKSLQAGESMV